MMLESTSLPFRTTAAAVSSQELSIASIVISFSSLIFLPPLRFREIQIYAHPVFSRLCVRKNLPYFVHVFFRSCQRRAVMCQPHLLYLCLPGEFRRLVKGHMLIFHCLFRLLRLTVHSLTDK